MANDTALMAAASKFKEALRGELDWVRKDLSRIPGTYQDDITMLGTLSGGSTTSARAAARMLVNLERPMRAVRNGLAIADNPKLKLPLAINERKPLPIKARDRSGKIEGVEHLGSCVTLFDTALEETVAAGCGDLKAYL